MKLNRKLCTGAVLLFAFLFTSLLILGGNTQNDATLNPTPTTSPMPTVTPYQTSTVHP